MDTTKNNSNCLLPIGSLLQMGKYRVDRYLSSGGFGNTYVITNLQFDEQFAMKEFFMKGINERDDDSTTVSVSNKDNHTQFEQQREKFKKEARRLRKLDNKHIVRVHDLFDENGTTYYVMDLIDGQSVSSIMKQTGSPLSEEKAFNIVRQVLDALEVVHKEKIWHLDLKPGNIMLDKQGNAVVIDFGASKQLSAKEGYTSTSTALCYTPGYAPSEQIDQNMERIGPWTDLYALGATLYNMVTFNQPPSVSEIIDGNAFKYPSSISEKTQQLIQRMMSPSRQKRPQAVEEVYDYLVDVWEEPAKEDTLELESEETRIIEKGVKESGKSKDNNTNFDGRIDKTSLRPKISYVKYIIIFGVILLLLVYSIIKGFSDNTTNTNIKNDALENLSERVEANKMIDSLRHTNKVVDDFLSQIESQQGIAGKYHDTDIGLCTYTGSIDERHNPDGIGFAEFLDGRLYIGTFDHGIMDGSAYFRYNNGDTFEGTFSYNSFLTGKYTIFEDGSYFIGNFADGQPSKGQWYDKNGNKIN